MLKLIDNSRSQLESLCRHFRVKSLDVFGSAADGTFDASRSDLDFLVDFLPLETGQHADAYFGLLQGLQDVFGRKIDLVMTSAIRNRYFLEAVNKHKQAVYAA